MTHHAYYVAGNREKGIAAALTFTESELGLEPTENPDVVVLRYGLLSVDDARKLGEFATQAPLRGDKKVIIISTIRLFHEAQNALLKLFEEPSVDTTLILSIPSVGMLLPTLRSRLLPLPYMRTDDRGIEIPELATRFIAAPKNEREKMLELVLNRTKSDNDDEKQEARLEALELLGGIEQVLYAAYRKKNSTGSPSEVSILEDINAFIPILYQRSAPLKMIFEHILLTLPASTR